jgi:hypothetical protein
MQVTGIEIDREEARKRVEEFTAQRRRTLTEMDRALYRGYKALAEGLTLIDVNKAIKEAGHFEGNYCPKLAIARSDVETVFFDHRFGYDDKSPTDGGQFCAWRWNQAGSERGELYNRTQEEAKAAPEKGLIDHTEEIGLQIILEPGAIESPVDERRTNKRWFKSTYAALVPSIPFHLRPNGDSAKYFILWEVDEWKEYRALRAPRDPLLLVRIAHPIYVVVAQWDLTELEKRILENFRRQ